ncbi:hypothetical protein F5B20DRAFT_588534 [Whalleya microplaca]|nr:hypothetical protein F5B20DRAFT_588534 [Whalleya microplaca]
MSTTEISETQVSSDAPALAPLLKLLPGALVYTKSNPKYDEKRKTFNKDNKAQPMAIISPRCEREVQVAVKFCADNKISMTARGGGHDVPGRSLIEDGIVIDMSKLDTITISEDRTFATIGAGVLLIQLSAFLDSQSLYTPHGWCDQVGYVGWACGGGYGFSNGQHGLGAHQILGARVVTPSGNIVDTDDDDNLLWAIRGAGNGNFGVISEIRTKLYTRPQVLAGIVAFPLSEGREVLSKFEKLSQQDLHKQFSGDFVIGAAPGVGPSIQFFFQYFLDGNNHQQALEYKQKITDLGTVLMDNVTESTPHAFLQTFAPALRVICYMNHHSVSTAGLSDETIDILLNNPPPGRCMILFHHAHGKALLPHNGACVIRERHLVWGIQGTVLEGHTEEEKKTAFEWSENINREVRTRGLALDQGYWSFTPSKHMNTLRWYGKENTERLKALKDKYNPDNVFPQAYPTLP